MAISYQIHKDKRLVIATASGEMVLHEILQSMDQLFGDPDYSAEYDLLWDDRERTSILSPDDIQKIARRFKYYQGEKSPKRAFVISRTDKYGLTRIINIMTSVSTKAQIGIFQDRKEALAWLKH
ncbi:MAG: hypothetical protein ABFD81_16845 [Syntrophaceae bacterium]